MDVPVPVPAAGQVLVRTAASVVSAGTERMLVELAGKSMLGKAVARPDLVRKTLDKARREGPWAAMEAVRSRLNQPVPLGYSSAGVVEQVGAGVQGVHGGDRVACAGGGHAVHAEYAVVPSNLLAPLPDEVDFESGAFATLGAIALHGYRSTGSQLGEHVAVIGLGLLGQLAVQIVQAAGGQAFGVDLDPDRVALARDLGAQAALRNEAGEAGMAQTGGQGFDAVLICAHAADNDPLELAAELARDRARVVLIGVVDMQVPRAQYYEKELDLVVSRSYGPGRYDPRYEEQGHDYPIGYVRWTEQRNITAFLRLLQAGQVQVKPLITHRYQIAEAEAAYAALLEAQDPAPLGVLLTYDGSPPPEPRLPLRTGPRRKDAVVRLGALGAGNYAQQVTFPILKRLRQVELVGLATASGLSSAHAGRRFGFGYADSEAASLIQDEQINTVAVLTPHHLHAELTREALLAGKHVFCEKPLSIDLKGLDGVMEALEKTAGLLTVGFNRRFAPMARRMREFMAAAGEPLSVHYRVNAGALPADHWQHDPDIGGGRLIGEGCHFLDFLTYLIGALPTQVVTRGLPDAPRYADDNVTVTLRYADGSLGTLQYVAAGDAAYSKERVEAFGGGRVAVLDDFRRLELVSGGRKRVSRSWLRQDKGHRALWEAFSDAIRHGGEPPIPYRELQSVTRATIEAVHSLRSGEAINLGG